MKCMINEQTNNCILAPLEQLPKERITVYVTTRAFFALDHIPGVTASSIRVAVSSSSTYTQRHEWHRNHVNSCVFLWIYLSEDSHNVWLSDFNGRGRFFFLFRFKWGFLSWNTFHTSGVFNYNDVLRAVCVPHENVRICFEMDQSQVTMISRTVECRIESENVMIG